MKKLLFIIAVATTALQFASCGGNENTNQEPAKEDKVNPADLFKDDRPTYDAKAIDAAAPVVEVNISANGNTMAEMSYDQKEIKVSKGSTVKLTFKNNSTDAAMPHNWVLVLDGTMEAVATAGITAGKDKSYVPDSKDVLVHATLMGPGESTSITFPAPPAGKYQFVCTYPGHWSTMNGTFVVE